MKTTLTIAEQIKARELEFNSNYPGGAYYDYKSDTYYNCNGDVLRDISEYDAYSEGYTPFGDE